LRSLVLGGADPDHPQSQVSLLPLRNDQGSYDRHTLPDLSTSAQIGDYIQGRTAAWTQHLERKRAHHHAHATAAIPKRDRTAPKPRKKAARKSKRRWRVVHQNLPRPALCGES
jgi:hypothetical protein